MTSPKINKYFHPKKSFQSQFMNQQCLRSNGKEFNYRKHNFRLLPPLKKIFDIFRIHVKPFENQKFPIDKLFR